MSDLEHTAADGNQEVPRVPDAIAAYPEDRAQSHPQWDHDVPSGAHQPGTDESFSRTSRTAPEIRIPSPPRAPARDEVEAVLQAAVSVDVQTNLGGTVIGTQHITHVHHTNGYTYFAYRSEYLDVVRKVFSEPTPHPVTGLGPTATPARPVTFSAAVNHLARLGAVLVLDRAPDTGRTITAHALMAQLLDRGDIIEARPVPFGGSEYFSMNNLPRLRNNGYVLSLPPDDDDLTIDASFGATLQTIAEILGHDHSRLIVLTSPEQWQRIGIGAPAGIRVELGTSAPADIAAKWLTAQEPDFPVNRWCENAAMREIFDKSTPTEVLWLVNIILAEHYESLRADRIDSAAPQHGTVRGPRDFSEQVSNVVAARSNWEDKLLEWHDNAGRQRTSFQRNFLLAAAVLRGGPASVVYAHAAKLTTMLGDESTSHTGQQLPGLIALTKDINARRAPDETLEFTRPHWDDAALSYFWDDRPLARKTFLRWLVQVPRDLAMINDALESYPTDKVRDLAARIGEFALRWAIRHRRQRPLQEIVNAWYDTDLWPILIALLDAAATEHANTTYIHDLLLTWSKKTASHAQRLAVIEVCTGRFAQWHTLKALHRLKHIANDESSTLSNHLEKAFDTLYRDPTVRPTILDTVMRWCDPATNKITAGRRTFAVLAAAANNDGLPLLLEDLTPDPDTDPVAPGAYALEMVTCWRVLLDESTFVPAGSRMMDRALFLWLDTAIDHPDLASPILDVLRRAVADPAPGHWRAREALQTSSYHWAQSHDRHTPHMREDLRLRLSRLLSADLPVLTLSIEDPEPIDESTKVHFPDAPGQL